MKQRTSLFLLLGGSLLLYHRFVKRIKPPLFLFLGICLFILFIAYGLLRGSSETFGFVEKSQNLASSGVSIFSVSNEFEALFAGTYDLLNMKKEGLLDPVPWQAQVYDIVLMIPSQILPFEKWDPQAWYLAHYSTFPGYFMYNPICQAIVGLDWVGLFITGALLGFIWGRIHLWCVKKQSHFWPSFYYFWLMIWSYYVIRSTTFGFLVTSLQIYLPTMLTVMFLHHLISSRSEPATRKLSLKANDSLKA